MLTDQRRATRRDVVKAEAKSPQASVKAGGIYTCWRCSTLTLRAQRRQRRRQTPADVHPTGMRHY
eukprot:5156278-Pleurochrysis_carterae.AAC.4